MSPTHPRLLRAPEVCVNLWAYADEGGYILRIAARGYVLDGDDAAKLALLRQLGATDFLHAKWMGVSKAFVITRPGGEQMEGMAHTSMLADASTSGALFEPVLKRVAASIPQQMRTFDGDYQSFTLELPQDPLTVTTVVIEHDDGRLVPLVRD